MTKPRIKVKAGSRPVPDVVWLDVVTRLDIDPICVLDGAIEADLTHVVIAGYKADGSEYFAASMADGGETLWLIERLKKRLLEIEPEHLPPMADSPEGAVLPFTRRKGKYALCIDNESSHSPSRQAGDAHGVVRHG